MSETKHTPKRVEELREWLKVVEDTIFMTSEWFPHDAEMKADLLSLLDEYERTKPLIEAVMGADISSLTNEVFMFASYPMVEAMLRAALKLREGRKE